jgi:hypothetical protein
VCILLIIILPTRNLAVDQPQLLLYWAIVALGTPRS